MSNPEATETQRRGALSIAWRLFRPHTLTASFIPVLVGTALAYKTTGQVRWPLFAAMFVASTLIQAATNMFNEYFDYVKGLDTEESVGIAGAITEDKVAPRIILATAVATVCVALALGVYICANSSWWLAVIGTVCILVAIAYSAGPHPISATPFGELFAGGFMGTGIVLLACFIQQGSVGVGELLASIPFAILIGAILTANNIRDREGDAASGRCTLAILLGHERAVWFLAGCMVLANLWTVGLVMARQGSPWLLLSLGSLLTARSAIVHFRRATLPEMMVAMPRVAQTNTVYGLLFFAGILIGR